MLLGLAKILRRSWQLQNSCGLTDNEPRDHHDLAVREFERIVMHVRNIGVDLPEPGNQQPTLALPNKLNTRSYRTLSSNANLLLEARDFAGMIASGSGP